MIIESLKEDLEQVLTSPNELNSKPAPFLWNYFWNKSKQFKNCLSMVWTTLYYIHFGLMRLLVGLILTALNGPVGTESKDLEPTFGFLDYLDSGFFFRFFPHLQKLGLSFKFVSILSLAVWIPRKKRSYDYMIEHPLIINKILFFCSLVE